MESTERGHHLANFADLRESMRALFAHVETAQQAVQAHLDRTTSSDSITSDSGNDTVEPLTATRINDIVQSVSSKVSTWTDLQIQYPPNQSCLAPLSVAVSSNDASTNPGFEVLDPRLEADLAYCQAATMAAYGIELLRLALDGVQVDRRRVRQTSDILAKLCATLVDSRNWCRGAGMSRLEEAAGSYEQVRDMAKAPVSVLESERAATTENASPMMDEQGRWASAHVTNKYSQSYSGGLPLGLDASSKAEVDSDLELVCVALPKSARQNSGPTENQREGRDSRLGADAPGQLETFGQPTQQLNSCDLVWEVSSTSSASLHAPESDIDDGLDAGEGAVDEPVAPVFTIQLDNASTSEESVDGMDTSSVTDLASTVAATTQVTRETQLVVSDRQSVIRDGLLRQGFSELNIAAYFNKYSDGTHSLNDRIWGRWACWCAENDRDPCVRSEEDLRAFILPAVASKHWRKTWVDSINRIWLIIEGHPPPANPKAKLVATTAVLPNIPAAVYEQPVKLDRRSVIREGLLCQGFSKSRIAAYFKQYAPSTNHIYDGFWSHWACWCAENDRDPRIRSEVDLKTLVSRAVKSKPLRMTMEAQVKRIWSIIEGHPPPANRQGKRTK